MLRRWLLCPLACAMALPSVAQVDLSHLGQRDAAPRSQVLVLGTVHLSQAPKGFKASSLEPVLAKLEAFKPQIITVEQISGETCDLMRRHPAAYDPQDISTYCADTTLAKAATGLDVPAALAQAHATLKTWPAQPTASQRRHLAALFLAAGDPSSALVQWLQLPAAEQHAGDGLDDALASALTKRTDSDGETSLIAARLAARLGLQRLYPVDDHTGDNVDVTDAAGYGKAIQAAWDRDAAKLEPVRSKRANLWQQGDMLALYRYTNRPDVLRIDIDGDFGAALEDNAATHYGQIYVAGWETRNLRMAANIRATFRELPGSRVLTIVGSSHKPWLDSFLGQMQGVQIIDAETVLK